MWVLMGELYFVEQNGGPYDCPSIFWISHFIHDCSCPEMSSENSTDGSATIRSLPLWWLPSGDPLDPNDTTSRSFGHIEENLLNFCIVTRDIMLLSCERVHVDEFCTSYTTWHAVCNVISVNGARDTSLT